MTIITCFEHIENIPIINESLPLFKLGCFADCKIILNDFKFLVLFSDLMHTRLERNTKKNGFAIRGIIKHIMHVIDCLFYAFFCIYSIAIANKSLYV